jgi:hypothetical protein
VAHPLGREETENVEIGALFRRSKMGEARAVVNVMIGPEGGFDPGGSGSGARAGGDPCDLGPRILRTETAGIFVVSSLLYELRPLNFIVSSSRSRRSWKWIVGVSFVCGCSLVGGRVFCRFATLSHCWPRFFWGPWRGRFLDPAGMALGIYCGPSPGAGTIDAPLAPRVWHAFPSRSPILIIGGWWCLFPLWPRALPFWGRSPARGLFGARFRPR